MATATNQRIGRRERQRERRLELPLSKFKFRLLQNPLPPVEYLPPEQIEELHEASMQILEDIGMDFYDAEALAALEKAGARVDHKAQHAWLDRGLVMEAVANTPDFFTVRARNPAHHVKIGKNFITFLPMGGMAYVSSLDMERRTGTQAHTENFIKLSQMCNMLHVGGGGLAAQDVHVSVRHLRQAYAVYTLTDKVAGGSSHGRVMPQDAINMAKIVYGDDFDGDPVLFGNVNASSPLRYDERMLGGMITFAHAKQAMIVTPFILAGAMSPISIASAMAQQNAEALAGIALIQLINPGAPVVYGGFTTNTDMKTGSPAFGTPEGAWALLVGAQLARRYHLPYRGSGSLCSSNVPDAQAAYETMWTMWPAVMAHTNVVMHSLGWLENGLTVSYEKYILDLESLAMFHHFLEGFTINKETLALDMIAEVGPGGHHFGTPHTQARYQTEFYEPIVHSRIGYENWVVNGAQDAVQRANAIWKTLLAQYEPPYLDPGIEEGLREYAQRRERELEGIDLYTG
jgi:trimethylamine--corrinoid protein Co-methyltransferase